MGNRYSEEHEVKPVRTLGDLSPAQQRARDQLVSGLAFNRTPSGIPLDEWNKIQNARKRRRRALKGKG